MSEIQFAFWGRQINAKKSQENSSYNPKLGGFGGGGSVTAFCISDVEKIEKNKFGN